MLLFPGMEKEFKRYIPGDKKSASPGRDHARDEAEESRASRNKRTVQWPAGVMPFLKYWELKPAQYEARLQDLALQDVKVLGAFVPWSHLETDIYHSLRKLVRAAFNAKIQLKLFVMPELGVNYPNCGIPKDVLNHSSNLAVGKNGQVLYHGSAPNIFPLPSFFSPEVLKRFGSFLIKFGSILSEVFAETQSSQFCEVVVSNSLFNYYRPFGHQSKDHGDYSAALVIPFREFLDREYSHPASEPFKMQVYENHNRHRFLTHVEQTLREKTEMIFSKKSSQCRVRHIDLMNPECSPEMGYHALLTEAYHFHPALDRFYEAIAAAGDRGECILLNEMGIFRKFTDQEKFFLIMSGLIHCQTVHLSIDDKGMLSEGFRRKLADLSHVIDTHAMLPHRRMGYLASSRYSMNENCYAVLRQMAPGVVSLLTKIQWAEGDAQFKRFIFSDPQFILKSMDFINLVSLAKEGKVVAIPVPSQKLSNYQQEALLQLEKFKKSRKPLKVTTGIPYEVYEVETGYVVLYDMDSVLNLPGGVGERSDRSSAVDRGAIARFFQAMFGLAEIRSLCQVNDARIHLVSYASKENENHRLLFLVNSSREQVAVTLTFTEEVGLSGVGHTNAEWIQGKSFELVVPALGVLSMQMMDSSTSEEGDQRGKVWN